MKFDQTEVPRATGIVDLDKIRAKIGLQKAAAAKQSDRPDFGAAMTDEAKISVYRAVAAATGIPENSAGLAAVRIAARADPTSVFGALVVPDQPDGTQRTGGPYPGRPAIPETGGPNPGPAPVDDVDPLTGGPYPGTAPQDRTGGPNPGTVPMVSTGASLPGRLTGDEAGEPMPLSAVAIRSVEVTDPHVETHAPPPAEVVETEGDALLAMLRALRSR